MLYMSMIIQMHLPFLTAIINCILRDPFIRRKVLDNSQLFASTMKSIDEFVRLDQFIAVIARIFDETHMTMYGSPVTRCWMRTADKDTANEIVELRNAFMLTKEHVELDVMAVPIPSDRVFKSSSTDSMDTTQVNMDHEDSSESPENTLDYPVLAHRVLRAYLNMYPCSFVINTYDDDEEDYPRTSKATIIVDSNAAHKATIENLQTLLFSMQPILREEQVHLLFNNYLDCIVGGIIEQCNDNMPLELKFTSTSNVMDADDREVTMPYVITLGDHPFEDKIREVNKSLRDPITTLSGLVKDDENPCSYYAFTTGHCIEQHHTINDYDINGTIWPNNLKLNTIDDKYFKSNLSELTRDSLVPFVSDIAVLKPKMEVHNALDQAEFEVVNLISRYDEELNYFPVLPAEEDFLGTVNYRGQKTEGTMNVVGYGFRSQLISTCKINDLLHERIYVAKPKQPESGTEPGDSGAYCYKESDDGKVNVHSFLIGTISFQDRNTTYRHLTPAHFALEQIRKITSNRNLQFVKYLGPADKERSL